MTHTLTKAIINYLTLHGFVVWKPPNPQRGNKTRCKSQLLAGNTPPSGVGGLGIPDIIGYRKSDARFIGIEIKTGADKLSVKQLAFLRSLRQAGGIALVISNLDEFLRAVQYPSFLSESGFSGLKDKQD